MNDWEDVARPVLQAIWELEKENTERGIDGSGFGVTIDAQAVQDRSGVTRTAYQGAINRLVQDKMISWERYGFSSYDPKSVKPEGLRALKEWPTSEGLAEALPLILGALAEKVDDNTSRTVLDRAADIIQGVAVGTITGVVRSQLGV